jgi:hypothetical protein
MKKKVFRGSLKISDVIFLDKNGNGRMTWNNMVSPHDIQQLAKAEMKRLHHTQTLQLINAAQSIEKASAPAIYTYTQGTLEYPHL